MMLDNQNGSSEQALVAKLQESRQAEQPDLVSETTGGTEEAEMSQADEVVETSEPTDSYDDVETEAAPADYPDGGHEQSQVERHKVKVNGEEFEVDLDELRMGYQRDADYRRKTSELAEQRKSIEAENAKIAEKLSELGSFIEQKEQDIDWETLRDTDPSEYLRQKELQDERKKVYEREKAEQDEKLQAQQSEYVAQESQKLAELMGAKWGEKERTASFESAQAYMAELGVTDQEMMALTDHRLWKMAFDAAEYRKLMQKKGQVTQEVRNAPKSVKPGQRVTRSEKEINEARNKLRNSQKGNEVDNAVAFLKAKRGNKR